MSVLRLETIKKYTQYNNLLFISILLCWPSRVNENSSAINRIFWLSTLVQIYAFILRLRVLTCESSKAACGNFN